MSGYPCRFLALATVVAQSSGVLLANKEPLAQLTDIAGSCSVAKPDGTTSPAEEGVAYPYGSTITTDDDSSVVVVIASGTRAKLLPGSSLSLTGSMDSSTRGLQLHAGAVEVTLGKGIGEGETLLTSVLPAATVTGVDCTFRIDVTQEGDLTVAFVRTLEGGVTVTGPQYTVAALPKGSKLALITPPDLQFLRLKNMRGEYAITVKDRQGADKNLKTKEGHVVKIWREAVKGTDTIAVTVLVTDANGVLIDSIDSTQPQEAVPGLETPEPPAMPEITDEMVADATPAPEPPAEAPAKEKGAAKESKTRKRPTESDIARGYFTPTTAGTTTVAPTTPIGLN